MINFILLTFVANTIIPHAISYNKYMAQHINPIKDSSKSIATGTKFIRRLYIKLRSNNYDIIQKSINDIKNCIAKSQFNNYIKVSAVHLPIETKEIVTPAANHVYAKTNKKSYIITDRKCSVTIRSRENITKQDILSTLSTVNINSLVLVNMKWH